MIQTREDVIRALRVCSSEDTDCSECPAYYSSNLRKTCHQDDAMQYAADMLEADEKKLMEKQVEAVKAADVMPTMTAFHERCTELEIERRILLEDIHKETIAEVCALRDQVHNLTLYLTEAIALCPDDLKVLEDWHPGLPGYAPEPEEACAACRVGGNA